MARYRPPEPDIAIGVPLAVEEIDSSGIPLSVKLRPRLLTLRLDYWKKSGLRLKYTLEGIGDGTFNSEPYSDEKEARKAYECLIENIRKGNVVFELYPYERVEIRLTDSRD